MTPQITRAWAMPNKYTFNIKPLLDLVMKYKGSSCLWVDPFAGYCSPADERNDLDPLTPCHSHVEASEFMASFPSESRDGVIFDPPYSLTKLARCYKNIGLAKGNENPSGGFPNVKDHIARVLKVGGICVSFGWNTVGMGKTRGFAPLEYVICSHGGNRNDTLATVEVKTPTTP